MKKFGFVVTAIGIMIVFFSFGMDTAPEGTHNLGLLQSQMMTLHLGGIAALTGAILSSVGITLSRLEDAGILPPSDYKGSVGSADGSTTAG